jgi:hypothetical protein
MSPTPDLPSARERFRMRHRRAAQRELFERMARRFPNLRKRGRDASGNEGLPVDPNCPNHLIGGAAAALDFDKD